MAVLQQVVKVLGHRYDDLMETAGASNSMGSLLQTALFKQAAAAVKRQVINNTHTP